MQYYESPAYSKWCERIYGKDLKQMGMITLDELELFYREVEVSPHSHILDIGCGPGYISADVAKHYNSYILGIDIDEGAISHARKTFSNNTMLDFQLSDGNELVYEASSFDLICLFDTLYFTGTIERLRMLLDNCITMLKPGGKLAIFWSNYLNEKWNIFHMPELGACNTQVGIWGTDNNIPVKTFDLTDSYRKFWIKAQEEIIAAGTELRNEIPRTYESLIEECSFFSEMCSEGDAGRTFRWLYVFTKEMI